MTPLSHPHGSKFKMDAVELPRVGWCGPLLSLIFAEINLM